MGAWFGSKATTGLCQAIVSLMPPHRAYVETHPGGGAIMKRKPPASRNIGTDLNARSVRTFSRDHDVEPVHGCCHRFLPGFPFEGNEPVCSDPPCVQSTRRSQRRHRFDCTDGDHVEPLGILKPLPCQAMVSGHPSRPCDEHLSGWRSLEVQVSNQACIVTEKPWLDFEPGRPHWHSCAGRDCIDRRRIKRNAGSRAPPREGFEGAKIGITHSAAIGKAMAEWITEGETEWDLAAWDPRRFGDWATRDCAHSRASQHYDQQYAISFPHRILTRGRPVQRMPLF